MTSVCGEPSTSKFTLRIPTGLYKAQPAPASQTKAGWEPPPTRPGLGLETGQGVRRDAHSQIATRGPAMGVGDEHWASTRPESVKGSTPGQLKDTGLPA